MTPMCDQFLSTVIDDGLFLPHSVISQRKFKSKGSGKGLLTHSCFQSPKNNDPHLFVCPPESGNYALSGEKTKPTGTLLAPRKSYSPRGLSKGRTC